MSIQLTPKYSSPYANLVFTPIESPFQIYTDLNWRKPEYNYRSPRTFLKPEGATVEFYLELDSWNPTYSATQLTEFNPTSELEITVTSPLVFSDWIYLNGVFPSYDGTKEVVNSPVSSLQVKDDIGFTFNMTTATNYLRSIRYSYIQIGPIVTAETPIPINTANGISRATQYYKAFQRSGEDRGKTVILQINLGEGQTLDIDPSLDNTAGVLAISANAMQYDYMPTMDYWRGNTRLKYLARQNERVTLHVGANVNIPEDQTFDLLLHTTPAKEVYAIVGSPQISGPRYGLPALTLLYYPLNVFTVSEDSILITPSSNGFTWIDGKTWESRAYPSIQLDRWNPDPRFKYAKYGNTLYALEYGVNQNADTIWELTPTDGIEPGWGFDQRILSRIDKICGNYSFIEADSTNLYVSSDWSSTVAIYKYDRITGARSTLLAKASLPANGNSTAAKGKLPTAMWRDPNSNWLYFADSGLIRRIDVTNGFTETLSGTTRFSGSDPYQQYREGVGTAALWGSNIQGMVGIDNMLYVADTYSSVIRSLNLNTLQTILIAGQAPNVDASGWVQSENNGFRDGSRAESILNRIYGLTTWQGGLLAVDRENHIIWKIILPVSN